MNASHEEVAPVVVAAAADRVEAAKRPLEKKGGFGALGGEKAAIIAIAVHALLTDAAIEAFVDRAPIRWFAGAVVAAYFASTVLKWRHQAWPRRVADGFFVLLALMTAAAWWPPGAGQTLSIARLPGSIPLEITSAAAIVASAMLLTKASLLSDASKWIVWALSGYGVCAFLYGVITGSDYSKLFHGGSLWAGWPFWLQGAPLGAFVVVPGAVLALFVRLRPVSVADQRGWKLQVALALSLIIALSGVTKSGSGASKVPPSKGSTSVSTGAPSGFNEKPIDPARVTVSAKQAELGNDVERLFDYVRGIRHEPYQGVLRGGRGTLISEAANSLDKAVLLHELLEKAGRRSRFVHGTLGRAQAEKLLSGIFTQLFPAAKDESASDAKTRKFATSLAEQTTDQYQMIMKTLADSGVKIPKTSTPSPAHLREEIRDHYWLQYLDGGAWIDLDPSFPGATRGQKYTAAQETVDAVPARLFHRVVIRVVVEEKKNERLQKRTLLTYESNASDLSGASLLLTHVRGSWEHPVSRNSLSSALGTISAATAEDTAKPVLTIGREYRVGQPFGIRHPTHEGASGTRPIRGLGDVAGAIGGEGGDADAATGEWIEFEFLSPDGKVDTTERTIFDRIGFAARQKGSQRISDAPLRIDHPVAGIFCLSFYTGPLTNTGIGARSGQERNARAISGGERSPAMRISNLLELMNHTVVLVSDGLASPLRTKDQPAWYSYSSPRLIISALRSTPNSATLSIDLRRAQFRPVTTSENTFQLQVLRGALDGVVESRIMDTLFSSDGPAAKGLNPASYSTSRVFQEGMRDGIRPMLIMDPATASIPEEPAARIAAEMRRERAVITPRTTVALNGTPRTAWWSIDLKTGDTLAVTEDGLHQEYIIVVNTELNEASVFIRWAPEANFEALGPLGGRLTWDYGSLATLAKTFGKPFFTFTI